jgi:hypothetical protein
VFLEKVLFWGTHSLIRNYESPGVPQLHREKEMDDRLLCLNLIESLDAAYRGCNYSSSEEIRDWGKKFFTVLDSEYPEWIPHKELIYSVAQNILMVKGIMNKECDMCIHFFYKPKSFLLSIILMIQLYSRCNP